MQVWTTWFIGLHVSEALPRFFSKALWRPEVLCWQVLKRKPPTTEWPAFEWQCWGLSITCFQNPLIPAPPQVGKVGEASGNKLNPPSKRPELPSPLYFPPFPVCIYTASSSGHRPALFFFSFFWKGEGRRGHYFEPASRRMTTLTIFRRTHKANEGGKKNKRKEKRRFGGGRAARRRRGGQIIDSVQTYPIFRNRKESSRLTFI